jgi:hypothetical protein
MPHKAVCSIGWFIRKGRRKHVHLWPANCIGCRLESNTVSLTATEAWFTVSGSTSTNLMSLPISASGTNVFFRLVYP